MISESEQVMQHMLQKYADLVVKVGLNLREGQRLLIVTSREGGVSIDAAPLVRQIAISAYQAGARFVDVMWSDEQLRLIRFQHAPRDSFEEYPTWLSEGMTKYVKRGDAIMTIMAGNPDLLSGQDPELVNIVQHTTLRNLRPVSELLSRDATNWLVICAASQGWAAKVFPNIPQEEQTAQLWNIIFRLCRLENPDPVATWRAHIRDLLARSDYLNRKQYVALKYTAPGTDLRIGLPHGHIWKSGRSISENGIDFTANLPTEEVFTLPHKDQVDGTVRASKALSYGGSLIKNFSLRFSAGRVVDLSAESGEATLRKLVETDEGSSHLGEVALVPHSSPISQSGLLFYNGLLDENAACHLALGRAYPITLQGGSAMSDPQFAEAGGNTSLLHVDFMIGCGEMDIDGLLENGSTEPIMRSGEWAIDI